jgi:hypothetical protein
MFLMFVLLLHMPTTPAAIEHARPQLPVAVRIESADAVASLAKTITDAVRDLWQPYVDVTFKPDDPKRPPADNELHLVITDRVISRPDGYDLGWIEFVNGRPSSLITVSVGAARALMLKSTWFGAPLTTRPEGLRTRFIVRALATAVAHEIGHYLLRSTAHSRSGLMRGRFSADDIMDQRRAAFRLEAGDAKKIARHILEYAQASGGGKPPA